MARREEHAARAARYRRLTELYGRRGSMTTQQFCRKHGVSVWTFYQWRRKLHAEGAGSARRQAFVPLKLEAPASGFAAAVEVRLPGGLVARFASDVPASRLADIVTALGGGTCSA